MFVFEAGIIESVKMHFSGQTQEQKIISMNSEDFQSIEELDTYIEKQIIKTDLSVIFVTKHPK